MGNRAVIGFRADKDAIPVFLYSHWGGRDRYLDAQRAISAAEQRWNHPDYATRIAISQIVENYWSEETGFGISAGHNSFCLPDYDDVILVTWEDRMVEIVSADDSTKVLSATEFYDFLTEDPEDPEDPE
jgi:hypothetical protein